MAFSVVAPESWHAIMGSVALFACIIPTTVGVEANDEAKDTVLEDPSPTTRGADTTLTSLVDILAAKLETSSVRFLERLETSLSSSVSTAAKLETSLSMSAFVLFMMVAPPDVVSLYVSVESDVKRILSPLTDNDSVRNIFAIVLICT